MFKYSPKPQTPTFAGWLVKDRRLERSLEQRTRKRVLRILRNSRSALLVPYVLIEVRQFDNLTNKRGRAVAWNLDNFLQQNELCAWRAMEIVALVSTPHSRILRYLTKPFISLLTRKSYSNYIFTPSFGLEIKTFLKARTRRTINYHREHPSQQLEQQARPHYDVKSSHFPSTAQRFPASSEQASCLEGGGEALIRRHPMRGRRCWYLNLGAPWVYFPPFLLGNRC
jgi:hypothetical protein